jgi:hypothetical protein
MTKFDLMRINRYRGKFGAMTSSEALLIALDASQFKQGMRPFDPAFRKFAQDEIDFTEYAELLEKEENERPCVHPPGCTRCNWCGFKKGENERE